MVAGVTAAAGAAVRCTAAARLAVRLKGPDTLPVGRAAGGRAGRGEEPINREVLELVFRDQLSQSIDLKRLRPVTQ